MNKAALNFGSLMDMVGVELRHSQIAAEKAFVSVAGKQILPGHFTLLMLIRDNPGQNQTTLANAVHLDRSSMVPIIDDCESKGWLERSAFDGDRRAYAISLTSKGKRLLATLEKRVDVLEQRIGDGLGKENRALLISLLRSLQDVLSD